MRDLDLDLLTALVAVQHRAVQSDWPFYIIGAGLSTLRRTLAEARSYAERFAVREVGALPRAEATDAVRIPATALGARFTDEALTADRTTPGERSYLRAMVEVGGGEMASTSAIADRLSTPVTSLSPVRKSLIEKGTIYAERRGYVSFTVPNMDRFIRRQADADD